MKILFIYPNAESQLGFSYGLAHLSAVLKTRGHDVELLHVCEKLAPLPSFDEFCAAVKRAQPDVVGFSVVTNQWAYTTKLAQWTREALQPPTPDTRHPTPAPRQVPLVCGGIHATVTPEEVLRSGLFDYVFVGECDEAFAEFVDRLAAGQPVEALPNLGRLVNDEPRLNPVQPLPELSRLPPKDYSIFEFQRLIDAKNGWVGLMASRGCPFACTYCFNHAVVRRYQHDLRCTASQLNYIRFEPVPRLMDEIRHLLATYRNIRMFIFDDDLFTYSKDFVLEFCAAYPKVSKVPFVVNAHVGFFDTDRARHLAGAGCRIVKFGLESGSERIRRRVLNRHMTNPQIVDALATAHQHGLHSSVFVMVGLPQEQPEDLRATIELLAEARPGRFRWTYFFPYPGTKGYDLSVEGGFVDFERMKALANFTDASCLNFGPEQNLYLRKVGKILPWFVNAACAWPAAAEYKPRVEKLLAMDEAQWDAAAPSLLAEDSAVSERLQKQGLSHYAVKYNPFMGVVSDFFAMEG
ncbi:MAG: hypothetical protein A3K19_18015 [Lentisphaerae bacterium RIFOXYB12_FULL_65_16]|nr:MAG: hypothetical protein A3K18_10985 [Lentisphaerae bacterium RIFOXYA12_64_32]OGV87134.1 MAG: hypothetical protein A3K19_18015 [Lentisphaerae bacterium RIFOXYB12_FULL_65_16]